MLLVSAALNSPIGNILARATRLPHRIYYTRFTHLTRTHCLPPPTLVQPPEASPHLCKHPWHWCEAGGTRLRVKIEGYSTDGGACPPSHPCPAGLPPTLLFLSKCQTLPRETIQVLISVSATALPRPLPHPGLLTSTLTPARLLGPAGIWARAAGNGGKWR